MTAPTSYDEPATAGYTTLWGTTGGVPFLVYEQLDRLQKRRQERIWAGPAFTFDRTLYDHVRAHTDAADVSAFVALLRMAAGTRRFSLRLLSHPTAVPPELALQFDRLESIPLGDFDIDDETGERDFVWSSMTWHTLEADRTPAERLVQRELALARARADGRVTGQLYPLLQLGRLDEADALVFDQHRRFLVFTNAETQEALLGSKELAGHPSLLLLTAELRLRRLGANPQTIRDGASCLVAFAPPPDADALLRFRLLCRRSMAATYAGRRAEATRHLTRLSAMLDDVEDTRLRSAAHADPAIASRVAGDLFLAFWSAVQTDHHDLALGLADTMSEYGRPDDPLTQIDQLTAITEENFAGKRSRDPSGERPPLLEFSHAAAIVLLEEGADAEAIEHSRALAPRVRPAPTRSAVDALILLSRSLGSAEPIDGSLIDATVALSSAFWDDGQPSSFIAFAAVVAHLRAGRVSEARRIMRTASDTGWFVPTAHALIALQEDSPETALPLLEASATRTSLPRLRVISGVLSAAALAQRGLPEAAAARLAAEWRESPAPRLFRFALRFLDSDSFESLSRASRGVDLLDLGEVLVASASDPRPRGADPVLSPTEREIVALLGRGLSNAEIAEARSVSPNTVRTQLRMLYRKLGAANRSEAVAATTRLVPLDASSGEIG